MHVIGIICEYNPFHNGHLYHLQKIKELFPDSLVILVLNGYFLERGEISIISKENKTKIALQAGIDLVIELPFVYGTQSADIFANISITILEKLHCEYVVFGSEINDINTLEEIASYTLNNKEYDEDVKKYLDEGVNFPTALAKAIKIDFSFKPNDLLGISYIKSIKMNKYKIKPITIKRTNDYLDTNLDNDIVSASNIRSRLQMGENIAKYVPKYTLDYLENIDENKLFNLLKYKIITDKDLSIYLDVDEGIENRLKKVINDVKNMEELISKVKSKRYTYNKIRRMFIHILTGLTKNDNKTLKFDYLKVLGFNKKGQEYLNGIKKDIDISIIPNKDSLIYNYELKVAQIYDLLLNTNTTTFEVKNKPIKY